MKTVSTFTALALSLSLLSCSSSKKDDPTPPTNPTTNTRATQATAVVTYPSLTTAATANVRVELRYWQKYRLVSNAPAQFSMPSDPGFGVITSQTNSGAASPDYLSTRTLYFGDFPRGTSLRVLLRLADVTRANAASQDGQVHADLLINGNPRASLELDALYPAFGLVSQYPDGVAATATVTAD